MLTGALLCAIGVSFILLPLIAVADGQICMFTDASGVFQQVNSLDEVPEAFRDDAQCIREVVRKDVPLAKPRVSGGAPSGLQHRTQYGNLARPEDVSLDGSLRRESMASSIGRIELRWPRKVERLFGRTPVRAMQDAARAVSKAVKQSGFPSHIRTLDQEWQVVFMDADLPEKQIPSYLIQSCHPAWMVPPSSIYVVSQRVSSGCGGSARSHAVADAELAEVLIHELGHAIEFRLIPHQFGVSRVRAEGFATWFEGFASQYSSVISSGAVARKHFRLLKQHPGGAGFTGSAADYARASLVFYVIEEKFRVPGIIKVYERIARTGQGFMEAVKDEFSWSDRRLKEEVGELVRKRVR
jgi:hypothetical protein